MFELLSQVSTDASQSNLPQILTLVALSLIIFFLLRRSFRYFGRRPKNSPPIIMTPRPGAQSRGLSASAPQELMQWEVEMHEVARELSARLDSKMVALEKLIRDADRAAARLEAAIDPNKSENSTKTTPHNEIYTLADYGHNPTEIANRAGIPIGEVELILSLRSKQ